MKILTIIGTRPEIIRLSRVIPKLDKACDHILVHTGQNYSANLKDVFFEELGIRSPDVYLNSIGKSTIETVGNILTQTETLIKEHKPDRILILGDTNSGLAAYTAKRMGVPVFHMEAGNRCFDDEVPEEVNRPLIDKCSAVLLPYTEHSRKHLLNEGYSAKRITVTGNPITEVLTHYLPKAEKSDVLERLNLEKGGYFLSTLHREENIEHKERLESFISAFEEISTKHKKPILLSVHPRTKKKLEQFQISPKTDMVKFVDALGFFDFIQLQKNAACVLSDSGTVPEECSILGVPNVLLRTSTERPELFEAGSMIISGRKKNDIVNATNTALNQGNSWQIPLDYKDCNVSDKVTKIITSQIL